MTCHTGRETSHERLAPMNLPIAAACDICFVDRLIKDFAFSLGYATNASLPLDGDKKNKITRFRQDCVDVCDSDRISSANRIFMFSSVSPPPAMAARYTST